MIPLQVRVLRKQRDWTQAHLAGESKLTQGVISRAEDPEYGNLTVNTLVRIGAGFDCAFVGRFVPFSELGRWYVALENEKALEVPTFGDDHGVIDRIDVGKATLPAPAIPQRYVVNARVSSGGTGRLLQMPGHQNDLTADFSATPSPPERTVTDIYPHRASPLRIPTPALEEYYVPN
jgi:transcriptional regulator with XRE-family HTH domain